MLIGEKIVVICIIPEKSKEAEPTEELQIEHIWIVEVIPIEDEEYATFELADAVPESYKEDKDTLVSLWYIYSAVKHAAHKSQFICL